MISRSLLLLVKLLRLVVEFFLEFCADVDGVCPRDGTTTFCNWCCCCTVCGSLCSCSSSLSSSSMVMVSIALGVSITSTSLDIMATECRLSGELLCMQTTSASSALPASDLERCSFTADPAANAAAAAAAGSDDGVAAIAAGTTTANAPPGTFNIFAPFKLTAAAAVAGSGLILISVALGGLAGNGIGNGIGAGICAAMGFALGVAATVAVGLEVLLLLLPGLLHLKDFVRISAPEFAWA